MTMKARVEVSGESFIVRLPASVVDDLHLSNGCEVEISVESERLVLAASANVNTELDGLLSRITAENRHDEIEWGRSAGAEEW